MKTRFTEKASCWLSFRRSMVLGVIGIWLSVVPLATAGWILQDSERLETADGSFTQLVRKTVAGDCTVQMHAVFFDAGHCELRVIDHPGESGDLDSAMRAHHCVAGVNGSYFHPDRTPLGLVISDGTEIHPRERARLLSGILIVKNGHFRLLRITEFSPDKRITQALQSGPFLIDRGAVVAGLESTRRANRTVVLSDGKDAGALLVCDAVTLAEMATILATPGIIREIKLERALNLDGGSSTGFWAAAAPEPFYLAETKSVRNYLALLPKTGSHSP